MFLHACQGSSIEFLHPDDRLGRHEGGIASSLPIPIMPMASHFGAASYQQKTSLSDRPGILVPALRPSSSVAARKAVYAERDRLRDIDPGALEFIDDLDDDDEDDVEADTEVGSVGRRRALKILKARDELPEAGEYSPLSKMPLPLTSLFRRHVEKFGVKEVVRLLTIDNHILSSILIDPRRCMLYCYRQLIPYSQLVYCSLSLCFAMLSCTYCIATLHGPWTASVCVPFASMRFATIIHKVELGVRSLNKTATVQVIRDETHYI